MTAAAGLGVNLESHRRVDWAFLAAFCSSSQCRSVLCLGRSREPVAVACEPDSVAWPVCILRLREFKISLCFGSSHGDRAEWAADSTAFERL